VKLNNGKSNISHKYEMEKQQKEHNNDINELKEQIKILQHKIFK
jgi:hypothetical protein